MTYFGNAYASTGTFAMRASPNGGLNSINDRSTVYDAVSGYVYIGWVSSAGNVELLTWDPVTPGAVTTVTLATGLELHAAPCILIRNDGYILVGWSAHDGTTISLARSTNPNDASAFDAPLVLTAATLDTWPDFTYIYLHQLPSESNRIHMFWREFHTEGRLAHTYSDDGGSTWALRNLILVAQGGAGEVVYWKSIDDGAGKIHVIHTDTQRSDANPSSLFHRYYDAADGLWHKSDGTTVSSTDPATSTLIHDDSLGPINPIAIGIEGDGTPYVSFTIYRSGTTSTDFYVARYRSGAWQNDFVVNSGGVITGNRYLANISVNAANPDRALAIVKSGTYFEAFLYTSPDDGVTWNGTQLTTGSSTNAFGAQAVLNAPSGLEWHWPRGSYTSDANYTVGTEGYGA